MNLLLNKFPTKELQMRDAAHHKHPFTAQAELGEKGARVITRANGVFVYDSEGEEILDAMAGLWCVNIGYGRHELCLLYTSPSPRDGLLSRMPSSA